MLFDRILHTPSKPDIVFSKRKEEERKKVRKGKKKEEWLGVGGEEEV